MGMLNIQSCYELLFRFYQILLRFSGCYFIFHYASGTRVLGYILPYMNYNLIKELILKKSVFFRACYLLLLKLSYVMCKGVRPKFYRLSFIKPQLFFKSPNPYNILNLPSYVIISFELFKYSKQEIIRSLENKSEVYSKT